MAAVVVNNIEVNQQPGGGAFTDPFQFEVTFECLDDLEDDIEWKVVYVGSADDQEHDQELESILVGPVPKGTMKFLLESPSPDVSKIPPHEIRGVTVVLVTCSYKDKEFVRIGYYVNNDYHTQEMLDNPPANMTTEQMIPHLKRQILADKPRVTRYPIEWDNPIEDHSHAELMAGEENMAEGDDLMAEDDEDEAGGAYEDEEDSNDGMLMESGVEHGGMDSGMDGMASAPESMAMAR